MAAVPLIEGAYEFGLFTAGSIAGQVIQDNSQAMVKWVEEKEAEAVRLIEEIPILLNDNYRKRRKGQAGQVVDLPLVSNDPSEKAMVVYGQSTIAPYRQRKRRTTRRDVPRIASTDEPTYVSRALAVIPDSDDQKMSFNNSQRRITTNMVYFRGKRRSRYGRRARRRRFKKKKYVTKRGVKAMLGAHSKVCAPYNSWSRTLGYNLGLAVAVSSGAYGIIYRGVMGGLLSSRDDMHTLRDFFEKYRTDTTTDDVGDPTPGIDIGNYAMHLRKRRYTVEMHNPMNEKVRAKFWLVKCLQETGNTPLTLWTNEYDQAYYDDGVPANAPDMTKDPITYPTQFKEWNANYKIVKKWQTIFGAGDVAQIKFKLPACTFRGDDFATDPLHIRLNRNITFFFMYELKGVPTHSSTGTTTNVNWTPAGLDAIMIHSLEGAISAQPSQKTFHTPNAEAITTATSYLPDNNAAIAWQ